jgi:hypothetical protein
MPPEHIQRAVSAAIGGSFVAIFGESFQRVQEIAHDVEEAMPAELVEHVSRVNGRHSIDFVGGGRIRFISTNSRGGRGLSVDRVFVPVGTAPDVLANILPMLVTSREAVLTGY